jgi:iron complex outermembrane receptor protein
LRRVWDGDGFDAYTFLFQNLYALQPNQGSIARAQFRTSNRKAATKIIFLLIFSLSAKLHLETGLAFNTTRYSLLIFCSSGNSSELAYTFGEVCPQRAFL